MAGANGVVPVTVSFLNLQDWGIAIHKKNKSFDKMIDSACLAYKKLFQQEAVLRVDKMVKMKLN